MTGSSAEREGPGATGEGTRMTDDDHLEHQRRDREEQTDTRHDLTIITGHAQIVRRRAKVGLGPTEDELIDHMEAIIRAALRLGRRLDR